jgi:alkanesulfonate monooxygenase SsuD/methylene tetrahydromethanopterin reductase-like flavin-dependent oxidoreductase (luciferase family)
MAQRQMHLVAFLMTGPTCDGFILTPTTFPGMFEQFCKTVVPLLQQRGVFRKRYTGTALRQHLHG